MVKSSDLLKSICKPGDVLNTKPINYNVFRGFKISKFFKGIVDIVTRAGVYIGLVGIKNAQKEVFGKSSNYEDTHTMLYIDWQHVFSVQLPYPKFDSLKDFDDETISVYRYTEKEFTDKDITFMYDTASKIIKGKHKYDMGQLVDFLVSTINGYPFDAENKLFDQGRYNLVCSVGVATIFNAWRKKYNKTHKKKLFQLFSILREATWSKEFIEKFNKQGYWDIDRTFPANFANTETHFRGEFKLIAKVQNGKIIG